MSESKSDNKQSFFEKVSNGTAKWFREMRSELKKVVWPTPKQVVNNTIVVIVMIFVVGIFIWLADLVLLRGVSALVNLRI